MTKIQTTFRPDYEWPESRSESRNTETNQTSTRLRGIYFIDPDDEESKEILTNVKRKLERPLAPAMPCKRQPSTTKVAAKPEIASVKNSKTVFCCIVEPHESTRQRAESSQSRCLIKNWCTSSSRCHKQWKYWMQRPQWFKKWEKVKSRKEYILEHKETKNVHFAALMDIYLLKNAE